MNKYQNRQQAGQVLAKALHAYANRQDTLVLALPRGGVPVAFEIAKALHLPLDVFIVRKLGVPGHSELAMGAIAMGGAQVFNDDIILDMQITPEEVETVIAKEQAELSRREKAYRGTHDFPSLKNKTVILVDDGIATGATIRVAIKALRQLDADYIIVAVPVVEESMGEVMQLMVDEFVCPMRPSPLQAVGSWYEDFSQTEDEEVYTLLNAAKEFSSRTK